jgi:hypothetical protein
MRIQHMTFPQSTLEEIIESERQMLLTAQDRYGNHYAQSLMPSCMLLHEFRA